MNEIKTTSHEPSAKETLDTIRHILNIQPTLTGADYLGELIKNTANHLGVKYAFVGHVDTSSAGAIHTDVVWGNDQFLENFTYELESTPCKIVTSGERVCLHEHSVCNKFPDDKLLKQMKIESYIGAPTITPNGQCLGALVLLDDRPMENHEHLKAVVDFLAQRISAEYERYNIQKELQTIIDSQTHDLKQANVQLQNTVEELERTREQLEIKSRIDPLTHVNNRDWFTALAKLQLKSASRNDYPIALLFIDLDHFKQVNDQYGHVIGDIVLEEAAERIKACTRDTDILGRFGGEEFILLSPYADKEAACHLAKRIKDAISRTPVQTPENNVFITTSIGINVSEHADCELRVLLEHADSALYQAKESGRNRFMVY